MVQVLASVISIGTSTYKYKDLHLSGVSYNGDGSATAPSITFGVDTNTGFYRVGSDKIGFVTAGSLRAQLDNSGNFLFGKSSDSTSGAGVYIESSSINYGRINFISELTSATPVAFYYDNGTTSTQIGTISQSSTATSYNTSSDQRLKENIADADDAGSKDRRHPSTQV